MQHTNTHGQPAAGGYRYRWVVLFMAWLAFLFSFVDRLAWANVAVSVGGSIGLSVAELGVFVTAFYVGYVLANAGGGFLVDRLGGRVMLMLALVPLGCFTFCFGFVQSIGAGIAVQLLMGLAAGVDYAACVKLITAWFDRRDRGRALGIFMTGSSLGVILTNFTVPKMLTHLGWAGVYHSLGVVTVVLGVLVFIFLRDAPPDVTVGERTDKVDFRPLLRNRDLLLLAVVGFGALWGTWGTAFWANALLIKGYGYSAAKAGTIVGLFGVGAVVAKPVVGLVTDLLGGIRKIPIILCLAGFVVMLLVFGALHSATAFMVAAPLLGVFAFVYSPLTAAIIAEVAGQRLAGAATGLTNAFWQIGSAIVPLAVGAAFHYTHSFYAAFVTLAVGPLLGAVVMLFVREPRAR